MEETRLASEKDEAQHGPRAGESEPPRFIPDEEGLRVSSGIWTALAIGAAIWLAVWIFFF